MASSQAVSSFSYKSANVSFVFRTTASTSAKLIALYPNAVDCGKEMCGRFSRGCENRGEWLRQLALDGLRRFVLAQAEEDWLAHRAVGGPFLEGDLAYERRQHPVRRRVRLRLDAKRTAA